MKNKHQIHTALKTVILAFLLAASSAAFAQTLYVSRSSDVAQVDSTGTVSTFAAISFSQGLAFDAVGNLYSLDFFGAIRKIAPNGTVTPFASLSGGTYRGLAFDGLASFYAVDSGESASLWSKRPHFQDFFGWPRQSVCRPLHQLFT